jgi:hypothetical protein
MDGVLEREQELAPEDTSMAMDTKENMRGLVVSDALGVDRSESQCLRMMISDLS